MNKNMGKCLKENVYFNQHNLNITAFLLNLDEEKKG